MKRVFVAIDISEEARSKAASYIDMLRRSARDIRVGWEKPEKLHLTVKFLGDVDDRQLSHIEQTVNRIASELSVFRSRIYGTGRFPPKGDPRILWLGVTDNVNFQEIARSLNHELASAGFAPEKREFRPHLTIARLREPRLSEALAVEHISNDFESVEFEVREIVIYESQLLPTGSVYRKLASFPLQSV